MSLKILFVCTGNTCRSPMAEGIFKDMVKKRGLEDKILCQSAGLSPVENDIVSENAVAACKEIGVNIKGHLARRLTGDEIPMWDVFFTMSDTHAYILEKAGAPKEKIYVPGYIADPYGQGMEAYRESRDKLKKELEIFLDNIVDVL